MQQTRKASVSSAFMRFTIELPVDSDQAAPTPDLS
jgi:hypothetical protein